MNSHKSKLVLLLAGLVLVLTAPAQSVVVQSQTGSAESSRRAEQQASDSLELAKAIDKTISAGQVHSYRFEAIAGQYLHIEVDQRGIDLLVTLFGPDGMKILEIDRTEAFGPETALRIIHLSGEYRFEVRPVEENSTPGRYQIRINEQRTAREEDRALISAMTTAVDALAEGDDLRDKGGPESLNSSIERYNKALTVWREVGDKHWEARTLNNLGVTFQLLGEKEKALEALNQALPIFRSLGNLSSQAATLDNIASVSDSLGAASSEKRKALDYYNQELLILKEIGDRSGEVNTLNKMGLVYNSLGENQRALEFYRQALPLSRLVIGRTGEAKTLYNTGLVYDGLGDRQKALEFYNQALALFRTVANRGAEAWTLHNIGGVYHALGEMQKALEFYNESLQLDRALGNRLGEARTLNSIGGVYSNLGEKQKALEFYNQALTISHSVGDRSGEASTLNNIGGVYDSLGEVQKALDLYEQALSLYRAVGGRSGEATTLNNIAYIYNSLGETPKALEVYLQSLELERALGDRAGEATSLNNVGRAYDDLGDTQKALEFFNHALLLHRAVGDRSGEATTLNNIGGVFEDLGQTQKALEFLNLALPLFRVVGDRSGEANILNSIGVAYSTLGEKQKGLDYYNQALTLAREVGERSLEANTLGNLLAEWRDLGKPSLAVFYGKQAVNVYQQLRGNITGLDKDLQKTFLRTKEHVYRALADLLIALGRLPEAQQVLNLLKDQQFFDFNRDMRKPPSRLTLTAHEALITERYERASKRIEVVSRQLDELKRKVSEPQPRAETVQQLQAQLKTAPDELLAVLKEAEAQFAQPGAERDKVGEIADTRELQAALRELSQQTAQKVVAVYTLVGDDDFRALLITADKITAASQPIKGEALNQKALQLWGLLQSDKYDPTTLAQELYSIVFKPVEAQLPEDTKAILWSLDGNLRYLPMAALHDGKQYLIERYNHVVFTRADRERLLRPVSTRWAGLGLGSSKAHTVKLLGDRIRFNALPGVSEELRVIFRKNGSGGIIEGTVLPDAEFTRTAMLAALKQKRPLVHISSHFSFRPGDEARSFLLLGDGTAMTLEEMKQHPGLFAGVELLTLSACNTAAQRADANGREMDGFAELAQRLGAGSVMATLWRVADNSTPWLMREFYQTRQTGNGLTKAEAIRRAQLALLNGTAQTEPLPETQKGDSSPVKIVITPRESKRDSASRSGEIVYVDQKEAPTFKRDDKKAFAHPYYWAPFILIGNSR